MFWSPDFVLGTTRIVITQNLEMSLQLLSDCHPSMKKGYKQEAEGNEAKCSAAEGATAVDGCWRFYCAPSVGLLPQLELWLLEQPVLGQEAG